MDTSSLKEYRCTCGKLLFKGLILLSVIEIKCKRCGTVRLIRETNSEDNRPFFFAIFLDGNGIIINLSHTVVMILGWSTADMVGKPIDDFCPPLAGSGDDTRPLCIRNMPKAFDIRNNICIHRDGHQIPMESYFVCDYNDGKFSGYRMFNWIGEDVHI